LATPSPTPAPAGPIIEVIAGGGAQAPAVGGIATNAQLARPSGVAFAPDGSMWIVDANLAQIIHVSTSGQIELVQGGVLLDPEGVCVAPDGTVYVADRAIYEVLSVAPGGGWTRVAGGDQAGSSGDGHLARRALLASPLDVATDSAGDVFIVDAAAQVVRRIDAATGIISTVAGNRTGGFSGDGAAATSAQIYGAQSIAISHNSLFIADTTNHRVRAVDLTTGLISTVAGTGDGTAVAYNPLLTGLQTPVARPNSIAADAAGNVYFPVFWGDRGTIVMRLGPQGDMTPIAGGGSSATAGVAATNFILPDVLGLAVDPASGDLAIAGSDGKIYRVADVAAIP
jgi:sugar lactone lactonase YvrE